jgi:hypothetical protein
MMFTTILQSFKLKFNLCMGKKITKIALWGNLNHITKLMG